MKLIRLLSFVTGCILAAQLTGCANMKTTPPVASLETTAALRTAGLVPVNLGTFNAGSKVASIDSGTSIRGNPIASSVDNSFTQYLRETLKVELVAAGLYDAQSGTVITGTLTDSELDAAIGTGRALVAARFVVTRDGKVVFDQEKKVNSSWESSFMGAVAIPAAAREYELSYRKLVSALLNDPEFRKVLLKN